MGLFFSPLSVIGFFSLGYLIVSLLSLAVHYSSYPTSVSLDLNNESLTKNNMYFNLTVMASTWLVQVVLILLFYIYGLKGSNSSNAMMWISVFSFASVFFIYTLTKISSFKNAFENTIGYAAVYLMLIFYGGKELFPINEAMKHVYDGINYKPYFLLTLLSNSSVKVIEDIKNLITKIGGNKDNSNKDTNEDTNEICKYVFLKNRFGLLAMFYVCTLINVFIIINHIKDI